MKYGVDAVGIISLCFVFYGIGMVMGNAFNAACYTKTPTVINLTGFWFLQVLLANVLSIHWA